MRAVEVFRRRGGWGLGTTASVGSPRLVARHCLSPSPRDVFPQGLPDEYAFVTTFRFRKSSRKEDWYIWQVIDQYGIPQVHRPQRSFLGPASPLPGLSRASVLGLDVQRRGGPGVSHLTTPWALLPLGRVACWLSGGRGPVSPQAWQLLCGPMAPACPQPEEARDGGGESGSGSADPVPICVWVWP